MKDIDQLHAEALELDQAAIKQRSAWYHLIMTFTRPYRSSESNLIRAVNDAMRHMHTEAIREDRRRFPTIECKGPCCYNALKDQCEDATCQCHS